MLDSSFTTTKGGTQKFAFPFAFAAISHKIPLLDRHITRQFLPSLFFSVAVCTILSELIGLTFEQIKFVAHGQVSFDTAVYVHLLKLPAFISIGLPLAMLLATLIACSELAYNKEIVALRSFGVSLLRIARSILIIGVTTAIIAFIFHEWLVPPGNYQAAILLEQEWGVDRAELAKYNKKEIVYLQFDHGQAESDLDFLFFAHRFDGEQMKGVTFLKYEHQHLKEIIVSEAARWDEAKEFWRLTSGYQYLLNDKGAYEKITPFQELPLRVTRNVLDYADDHRDNREMNVIALHQRLKIIQNTDNSKQIRPLKMSIQERYAMPFSCFVFALLGSAVGFTTATASKANSFGIAALLILAYYMIQFVANCLIVVGALPVSLGVWLPNLLGLALGYDLLRRRFLLTVSR